LVIFCCTTSAAFAAAKGEHGKQVVARVAAVKPDGVLTLSSIGDVVLADIVYPNREAAQNWLAEHALQKEFAFRVIGENRYGRTRVISSLQPDMLNDGTAVYVAADSAIESSWQNAEARARKEQIGVWSDPERQLLIAASHAQQYLGEFHVIEGVVTRIYESKKATYINFGEDWHSDFSITVLAKHRRSMKGLLNGLKAGDRIRVRGVVFEENGPMIHLQHADNLERL
jgi:hypothetical protein